MKRLLVIGAGGFIGGFIASQGLERGYDVTVAVRESTSRRYLTDPRLNFLVLDYGDADAVAAAMREALPQGERWNYVIHNLGATKCANFRDFDTINYRYLVNIVEALKVTGKMPERFLFMSSLSAMGPVDEKSYRPITNADTPHPNTRYGLSKMKAEDYLRYRSGIPYIIFRATGVYGPREKDYLMMIKSIDGHIDVGMGYRKQMLTFIYVDDLVGAMFDALASGVSDKTYIISEPRAYTQKEFRTMVAEALGGRWVLPLKLPMWTVFAVSAVAEKIAAWRGKASTLNRDKYKIMKQRNWNCDVSDAQADFGFHADFPLERGVRATVDAYLAGKKKKSAD
ncbi:NAD(P)-dependent oxidoreductase [Muribaculaceae bacterium Isolate-002 (NCI)]|nr:NAD(P)-dependent oxidoreductase [Muribaculaceae bacterium Isolate-002 (NCI)]